TGAYGHSRVADFFQHSSLCKVGGLYCGALLLRRVFYYARDVQPTIAFVIWLQSEPTVLSKRQILGTHSCMLLTRLVAANSFSENSRITHALVAKSIPQKKKQTTPHDLLVGVMKRNRLWND